MPFVHGPLMCTLPPKPSSVQSVTLSKARAQLYACALLQFHFIHGDFIRWLSGQYTNHHCAWCQDFATMVQTAKRPLSSDYPVPDYPRAFCICTEGVPLQGDFTTPPSQILSRDDYDNHPAVETNSVSVESKLVKEEDKSFHIHFPHFIIRFLPGPVLAPLQWVTCKGKGKGKGRICVDCTNGPDVAGSANTSIPKPNVANADECPPVFYQHLFARHLRCLWRTRITYPTEEILQHCNDIEAAFLHLQCW
jgi:hypothetical protein